MFPRCKIFAYSPKVFKLVYILANVPGYLIRKLQKVMNSSVRFIYDLKRRDQITPYMKLAHFLPVTYRIRYKLCMLVYKTLNGQAPEYLQNMIIRRESSLRGSRDDMMLHMPQERKTIYYSMCTHWNELPVELRQSSDIMKFKTQLKTHYFNIVYSANWESDSDILSDEI